MEEFLILWRLELKLWRFFGEKNWGGFWRFSAKKGALSDLELLSTLSMMFVSHVSTSEGYRGGGSNSHFSTSCLSEGTFT